MFLYWNVRDNWYDNTLIQLKTQISWPTPVISRMNWIDQVSLDVTYPHFHGNLSPLKKSFFLYKYLHWEQAILNTA